ALPTQSTFSTPEGSALTGPLATFTSSYAANPASDFSATIDWGDGTTTAGVIGTSANGYTVSAPSTGGHAYGDEGTFGLTITIILADDVPGTAAATVTHTVTVTDANVILVATTDNVVNTAEGTPFSGSVAAFTGSYEGAVAADFAATIDWGDGSTSAGTVT